ncbi:MAG: hypothetical protein AAGB05_11480 [Pseudomonadota bacterium]
MLKDTGSQDARAEGLSEASAESVPKARAKRGATPRATQKVGSQVLGVNADVLAALQSAVLHPEQTEAHNDLKGLLRAGVSRSDLVDIYIPQAARYFGQSWMDSRHSFAEVTIAVARLQGWLRDLEVARPAGDPFCLDAPEVLLVSPEGSQHTLGAMVAMSRFRRLGALVRLSIGQDSRTVGRIVRSGNYDMVAVSAAGNEGLDFLANLVNSIRSGIGPSPFVVLGGEILNQTREAPALIGADFGTCDPEEALRLCGLTTSAGVVSSAGQTPSSPRKKGDPGRVSETV